jgi:LmbE family N-acetylglucosaminyl deacetylase
MIECQLGSPQRPIRRILCLGAHCDDIEIGCGGTMLRLLHENSNREVYWRVFSSNPMRKQEALRSARLFLEPAKLKKVAVRNYRDGFFPSFHARIKDEFERMKNELSPDLILTHYRHDLHQDHRTIGEMTWNTFRNQLILEYEIPKYDGDLGSPNFFFHLDEEVCQKKIRCLLDAFRSQRKKPWFTEDTFRAILRLRGVESNAPGRFAEGFYCRKLVL